MRTLYSGDLVRFLMLGETNSMVGYHLIAKGYSIQLGVWGCYNPPPPLPAGPGQCPDGG